MKCIMYHYVRREKQEMPEFFYLHIDDFEKQIDYFCKNYHIVTHKEFDDCLEKNEIIENSILLTFDDGLSDHYEFVYPILKKRNLWGIFYLPTKPYEEKVLLDVHRTHYLIGKYGGEKIFQVINSLVTENDLIEGNKDFFANKTYTKQDNDIFTTKVKQIVNYYMKPDRKSNLLKKTMNILNEDEEFLSTQYYLNKEQINEMIDGGMSIGSHAHSHTLLSKLDFYNQDKEICKSIEILKNLTQSKMISSFCYPYGGSQSYNNKTLEILKQYGFKSAISVESRDVTQSDLKSKYEIPRYDCNEFEYGKVTKGKK